MQIEETKSMVIIDIPRICVPAENAELFIRTANQFWAETKDEMMRLYGSKRFEYDNKYVNGEFIPTIAVINSYSGVLDKKVDVEQLDIYVKLESDERYGMNTEINALWNSDKTAVPEEEEDEE